MVRKFLLTACVTALLGSLLWGACVACEGAFSPRKADNGCCLPSGKCNKKSLPVDPDHKYCKTLTLALQHYVKGDLAQLETSSTLVEAAGWVNSPISETRRLLALPWPDASPPDLVRLNSAFRI